MPFALTWPTPAVALRAFSGHLDAAELTRSFEAVMGDARFDGLRWNLVDLSQVSSVDVPTDTLELLAATAYGAAQSNPRVQVVIIAPNDTARTLVERYLAVRFAPFTVRLLHSFEEANHWLATQHAGVRFANDGALTLE